MDYNTLEDIVNPRRGRRWRTTTRWRILTIQNERKGGGNRQPEHEAEVPSLIVH